MTEGFTLPGSESETASVYIKIVRNQITPESNSTLSFGMEVSMRGGYTQHAALSNPSTLLFEGSVYDPTITSGPDAPDHKNPLLDSAFGKFTKGGTLKEVVDAALGMASAVSLRDTSDNVSSFTVHLMNLRARVSSLNDDDDENPFGDF